MNLFSVLNYLVDDINNLNDLYLSMNLFSVLNYLVDDINNLVSCRYLLMNSEFLLSKYILSKYEVVTIFQ